MSVDLKQVGDYGIKMEGCETMTIAPSSIFGGNTKNISKMRATMATNERVEALLDTLQDRVDEQGRVIEALEKRVTVLSNENNATYQYCVQIARAQNVIIDVLGFTLRMLNPQHIDNRTLEDLRERLDGARLPQEGLHTEQLQAKSKTVQGVQLGGASLSADVDAQLKRFVKEQDECGLWVEVEVAGEREGEGEGNLTRNSLIDVAKTVRRYLKEAQDESQDSADVSNGDAKDALLVDKKVGDVSRVQCCDIDAQLEALYRDFESLARSTMPSTTIKDANERRLDRMVALVRPILEEWAQKVECLKVELKGENERCQSLFEAKNHWADKSRMLMKIGGEYQEQNIKLNKERDALKAEVARLREALSKIQMATTYLSDGSSRELCIIAKEALESEGN